MVDPSRVRALLDRLEDETARLRKLAALSDDELLADADLLAAVKYRFIVAAETCIDVGQHIISSENLRVPSDFAGVFSALEEAGLLSSELARSLRQVARFGNLLVHAYADVDDRRVIEILKSRLDDFDAFRAEIARLLAP